METRGFREGKTTFLKPAKLRKQHQNPGKNSPQPLWNHYPNKPGKWIIWIRFRSKIHNWIKDKIDNLTQKIKKEEFYLLTAVQREITLLSKVVSNHLLQNSAKL